MPQDPIIKIRKNIPRPSPDILKGFSGIPTGYLVDIQGRRGAVHHGIRPMFDAPAFVGPAVTVKTVPDDNLAPYAALGVVEPGDVLVIATGDWTGSAVVGDLIVGMYKNAGVVGVVTDGMARDVMGLQTVGVPIYARGLTANSPQKNGPGEIGSEITIGGVIVRSGDLIAGDRDGIVVLPQEKISQALEEIKKVKAKEQGIEQKIAEGMIMPDWIKEFLSGAGVTYMD